jgi:hypothetical protein
MLARFLGRSPALLLLGGGLLLIWGSGGLQCIVQGQEQQLGNQDEFKKEMDNNYYNRKSALLKGERVPAADDKKVMDVMARWYVYQVTFTSAKTNPTAMARVHDQLEKELVDPLLATRFPEGVPGNREFKEKLGKPLADSLRKVLTLDFADNRIAIVNAALMLPVVARLKQEEVGDLLVELLNDKNRHDAVKVYAAKAMREFFPAHMVDFNDKPGDERVKRKFERDNARLQALVSFMDRKEPAPSDEGERDVIRYLRREAIISLADIKVPALWAYKKKQVEGPAAYELLRVLVKGKGAYQPPPSLSERVEAAIGLCRLKDTAGDGDYDPSLAVYAVGLCFADYATEYKTDYTNLVGRKDQKAPKEGSKIPTMPWRILSERFKYAIKDLVANTSKTPPAQANAQRLEKAITGMAESIRAYGAVEDLVGFRKVVDAMKPKTGKLYKMDGPQIEPDSLQERADGN